MNFLLETVEDYQEELTKARAEITQLRAELEEMTTIKDIHQNKRHEYFERAEKAEAELAAMTSQADAEALYSDGLRAELEQERELADGLSETLGAFVAKYGGRNAARQLKDYRHHCATRRNK